MFTKYPSITNHYDQRFLYKCDPNALYACTEKIHGTNFSFIVTDKEANSPVSAANSTVSEVIYAKRSGLIAKDERFYNYNSLNKYEQTLLELKRNEFSNVDFIQVFGEYAGDGIQKGIKYGEQDFYCFDILVEGEFLDFCMLQLFCSKYGLKMPPLLGIGTLNECLNIPNEYNSKILNIEDNICEGNVISPVYPQFLPNGKRLIIKSKNKKWTEKSKLPKLKEKAILSDELQEILTKAQELINTNRVENVLSKNPELIEKFGALLGATVKDALVEFEDLYPQYEELPKEVTKEINRYATPIVREVYLKRR